VGGGDGGVVGGRVGAVGVTRVVVGAAEVGTLDDALGFAVEGGLLVGVRGSTNATRAPSTFPGKLEGVAKSPPL
jgi:hypothetical protein